uniref:ATP synthase F0 subunit 8 n=1 Tax=Elaphe quatuorlineata TaxID=122934 RepID=A0A646QGU4_ELAQT|nr:ATP synthase F0 subunit 8 [Elaphe quatuorlineata]
MPQLDTIYTLMTYLWTWTVLYLMTQKIKTVMMTTCPTTRLTPKPTMTLQWL